MVEKDLFKMYSEINDSRKRIIEDFWNNISDEQKESFINRGKITPTEAFFCVLKDYQKSTTNNIPNNAILSKFQEMLIKYNIEQDNIDELLVIK